MNRVGLPIGCALGNSLIVQFLRGCYQEWDIPGELASICGPANDLL